MYTRDITTFGRNQQQPSEAIGGGIAKDIQYLSRQPRLIYDSAQKHKSQGMRDAMPVRLFLSGKKSSSIYCLKTSQARLSQTANYYLIII
jgi:hypothetical protein